MGDGRRPYPTQPAPVAPGPSAVPYLVAGTYAPPPPAPRGFTIRNRWSRQGRTGQSIGKKAMGIRLVGRRTLAPVGAGRDLLRAVTPPEAAAARSGLVPQRWVGKPRSTPPWLGSGHRVVTTLPRVKKWTPSVPWAWESPKSDCFQPPKE